MKILLSIPILLKIWLNVADKRAANLVGEQKMGGEQKNAQSYNCCSGSVHNTTIRHCRRVQLPGLGSIADDPACLSQGRETLQYYKGEVGAGTIEAGIWAVVMFDIINPDFDAIITCAYGPNGETRATLVVYGADGTDDDMRTRISERIKEVWKTR